jgi:hypothetical protein
MTNNKVTPENNSRSQKRPGILTVLSLVVLLIGVSHLFKFIQVLLNLRILQSLPLTVSPVYLAVDGLVWGVSGLILSWSMWTGQTWAGKAGLVLALLFAAAFWIDLIWISEPEQLQTRWLINLVFTALGLSAVFLSLNLANSRIFFSGNPAKIN